MLVRKRKICFWFLNIRFEICYVQLHKLEYNTSQEYISRPSKLGSHTFLDFIIVEN